MTQSEKDILARAMAVCSKSEKSAYDIRQSMTRWGLDDPAGQDKIIAWLQENSFIDEARYAGSYVRDKHRFNRWGKVKLTAMLRAKGISDSIIKEALDAIPADYYLETLKNDLLGKRKGIKASNQYELRGKLMRFALSRGYETELIYRVLDEVLD